MSSIEAMKNTYFVIMAGGIGSRFWPSSRQDLPKQFLDILGTGRSLIQMTYDRISSLIPSDQVIVMTHERYRKLTEEHLPELPAENILEEPCRQNTAPCVAYVSFHIAARNPNANLVILPADHLITKEDVFRKTLTTALDYVSHQPEILTLGMAPHRPDTGYGYIQLGKETGTANIYHVQAFREKPSLEVAKAYLANENYVWNAGIFISNVATMITAFDEHAPEIYKLLNVPDTYGERGEQAFIRQNYPLTPSISIDYAIMEKANNIVCYAVDIGWSDIGTWKSLYDIRQKDEGDIVINRNREDYDISDSNTLMIHTSQNKKVLIRGLENMLIIDQEDILMIWPLNKEQEIKNIREELASRWALE